MPALVLAQAVTRADSMAKKNIRKCGRSGTQACPICKRELPLVEHHIHGRKVPRWNQEWNVAWMCAACHDLVHQGKVIIEGWFRLNGIRTLEWRREGEEPKLDIGAKPPEYGE